MCRAKDLVVLDGQVQAGRNCIADRLKPQVAMRSDLVVLRKADDMLGASFRHRDRRLVGHQIVQEPNGLASLAPAITLFLFQRIELLENHHRNDHMVLIEIQGGSRVVNEDVGVQHKSAATDQFGIAH
ncbi:hypothetical protein D3C78_1660370 [compost metagenome]